MSANYDTITVEVDDPVCTITLNRPDRMNAWTLTMAAELQDAVSRAGDDTRVVGIVLTGAGRAFCAGGDLKELSPQSLRDALPSGKSEPATAPTGAQADDELSGPLAALMQLPKPVIAAINGPAAGMGAVIPLWSDLRFMSREAFLTMSFSQLGTVAESGSSWLLPRLIGPTAAMDLLLSSRRVKAEEALDLGLVNRIEAPEALVPAAQAYIENLARTCSPASMAAIKRQVNSQLHSGLAHAARDSGALLAAALDGGDIKEGWSAYLEKRAPQYARIGAA